MNGAGIGLLLFIRCGMKIERCVELILSILKLKLKKYFYSVENFCDRGQKVLKCSLLPYFVGQIKLTIYYNTCLFQLADLTVSKKPGTSH